MIDRNHDPGPGGTGDQGDAELDAMLAAADDSMLADISARLDLDAGLAAILGTPSRREIQPDLTRRSWPATGRAHLLRSAAALASRRARGRVVAIQDGIRATLRAPQEARRLAIEEDTRMGSRNHRRLPRWLRYIPKLVLLAEFSLLLYFFAALTAVSWRSPVSPGLVLAVLLSATVTVPYYGLLKITGRRMRTHNDHSGVVLFSELDGPSKTSLALATAVTAALMLGFIMHAGVIYALGAPTPVTGSLIVIIALALTIVSALANFLAAAVYARGGWNQLDRLNELVATLKRVRNMLPVGQVSARRAAAFIEMRLITRTLAGDLADYENKACSLVTDLLPVTRQCAELTSSYSQYLGQSLAMFLADSRRLTSYPRTIEETLRRGVIGDAGELALGLENAYELLSKLKAPGMEHVADLGAKIPQFANTLYSCRQEARDIWFLLSAAAVAAASLEWGHSDEDRLPDVRKLVELSDTIGLKCTRAWREASSLADRLAEVRDLNPVRQLASIEINASGADLSGTHLPDVDLLEGVIWTAETTWPPEVEEEVHARSREISPKVYQVHGGNGKRNQSWTVRV